jgi:hypothetical protein
MPLLTCFKEGLPEFSNSRVREDAYSRCIVLYRPISHKTRPKTGFVRFGTKPNWHDSCQTLFGNTAKIPDKTSLIAISGGRRLMRKSITGLLVTAVLALAAAAAVGQTEPTTTTTTVTKTVQNPDGTYTVIEYPVGKTVSLTLDPISLTGATGTATVLRDPTGTTIKLNLTGLPADLSTLNVYAVDPTGVATLLGPIEVTNGVGAFNTTTTLDKFMIIASPEASLSTYTPDTKILFRSAVPQGFAVVPLTSHPIGEQVSAVTTSGASSVYTVPMLNIPAYRTGKDTKLKVNFGGAMEGARANVFIEPHKNGRTEISFRFHELKEAPKGQVYTLWAVSPDNQFTKLGQIINTRGRNEAEIKSETSLPDFGLLVTMEGAGELVTPAGPRVSWVEVIKH